MACSQPATKFVLEVCAVWPLMTAGADASTDDEDGLASAAAYSSDQLTRRGRPACAEGGRDGGIGKRKPCVPGCQVCQTMPGGGGAAGPE